MLALRHNNLSNIFDEFERAAGQWSVPRENFYSKPSVNAWDDGDNYVVETQLPGVSQESIDIEVADNTLTLTVDKKEEEETEGKKYYLREFSAQSFSRKIKFGTAVNSEQVNASMENGVLTITLPKEEKTKPRKIKLAVN